MSILLVLALAAGTPNSTSDPVAHYESMRLGLCAPKPLPSGEYALLEPSPVARPCAGMPLELIEYDELFLRLDDPEAAESVRFRGHLKWGLYIGGAVLAAAAATTLFYGGSRDADWMPLLPFGLMGGAGISGVTGYLVGNVHGHDPHELHARIEAHNEALRDDLGVVADDGGVDQLRRELEENIATGQSAESRAELTARLEKAEELEQRSITMRRQFVTQQTTSYDTSTGRSSTSTRAFWEKEKPFLGGSSEPLEWDRFYVLVGREDIVEDTAWRRWIKRGGIVVGAAGTGAMLGGGAAVMLDEPNADRWKTVAYVGAGALVVGLLTAWLMPMGDYGDSELASHLTDEYNARLRQELLQEPVAAPTPQPQPQPVAADDAAPANDDLDI